MFLLHLKQTLFWYIDSNLISLVNILLFKLVTKPKLCQKWFVWRHKIEGDERRSEKKTPKKEMDNSSFLWRHMDDF